jgi:hypothetical protein
MIRVELPQVMQAALNMLPHPKEAAQSKIIFRRQRSPAERGERRMENSCTIRWRQDS